MSSWLVVINAWLVNILIPPSLVLFVVLANACSLTQMVTDPQVQGIKFWSVAHCGLGMPLDSQAGPSLKVEKENIKWRQVEEHQYLWTINYSDILSPNLFFSTSAMRSLLCEVQGRQGDTGILMDFVPGQGLGPRIDHDTEWSGLPHRRYS